MEDIVSNFKLSVEKKISLLKEDLKSIRTGKSNPSLVENIIVEAYGGSTKLKIMELATIMNEGPSALSITPFDPTTITDIEKAILKSPLGINPSTQGTRLIIKLPPLSQEQREKYIKLVGQKIEDCKKIIRDYRDHSRRKIKSLFEEKILREDEKFRLEKELDNETQKFMESIQQIRDKKEKGIIEL